MHIYIYIHDIHMYVCVCVCVCVCAVTRAATFAIGDGSLTTFISTQYFLTIVS